jgi:hypothetical protein
MFGTNNLEAWLFYADGSYVATRLLWFMNFMFQAPVNSHRTIELYLKTYLVSKGKIIKKGKQAWGHDLQQLARACTSHNEDFTDTALLRRISFFQRYHDLVRYPSEIEGKLEDGSLIWFGFDSAILPLDEVVAFIRPRIPLTNQAWTNSRLNTLYRNNEPEWSYQRKALIDHNSHIHEIICESTNNVRINFDPRFSLDLPGC